MNDHSNMNNASRGTASTGVTLAGFLLGAAFGAGVALLLAPAPGGETRRRIGETARRLGNAASEAVDHVRGGESDGGSRRSGGGHRGESIRQGGRSSREAPEGGRTPQPGPGTAA